MCIGFGNYIVDLYKSLLILVFALVSLSINAIPTGGVVTDGQATITTSPGYMQINQLTNQAVLNWQTFNIAADEHTHFQQPSANSIAINRVNAANGSSSIFGKLSSTGQIFLLNPSGVLFGPSSQINVGGILASTSDISMKAYREDGRIELMPNHNYQGSIINKGKITAIDGGYAAFVAPNVTNSGVIRARLGHVELSSGEYFTVDLFGDDLIHLKVPEDQINSSMKDYKVVHNGQIYADGGSVLISSGTADNIVSSIISMDGLLQADSIDANKGNIVLSATDTGYIEFKSNSAIYAAGGHLEVSAQDIKLASNSLIDVSSDNNAGEVYIGGNYQGKLLSESDFNAKTVVMDPDAVILANANIIGDGGKIILWSDDTTEVAGTLHAKGGSKSGNGGLIETSGLQKLDIKPQIDVSTASLNSLGKDGLWLLDPVSFFVDDLLAVSISTALASTNVKITTSDINFPDIVNEDDGYTPLPGGTNITPTPGPGAGDIVFDNKTETITWNTDNKFSVLADDSVIFNGNLDPTMPQIASLGSGDIHIQTNADTNNFGVAFGIGRVEFFDHAAPTPGNEVSVIESNNGGKVEIYYNPIIFGQPDMPIFSGVNKLIEYQLVYNEGNPIYPDRTIHNINDALISGSANQNFALAEDITIQQPFIGIGGAAALSGSNNDIPTPYTGSFDGLDHMVLGLNILDTQNRGLFNETDSTPSLVGGQYFKNISIFDAIVMTSPLDTSPLDTVSAGILIGQANISNNNHLTVSDITVSSSHVTTNVSIQGQPVFGNAGGLIGSTVGTDGSVLNLNNILTKTLNVDSTYTAGGLIGATDASAINITGDILSYTYIVNSLLPMPINNDATDGLTSNYAAGLIGRTTNSALILDASNSQISIMEASITSDNSLAGMETAAGGLIADFVGSSMLFNDITIKNNGVFANISTIDSTNNEAYAGGLIGVINDATTPDAVFNTINVDSEVMANVFSDGSTGSFQAYAGGLFGQAALNDADYNSTITITRTPSSIVFANASISGTAALAGGLSGFEQYNIVDYKSAISTNGATASVNNYSNTGTSSNLSSSAGGITGVAEYQTANFDGLITIGSAGSGRTPGTVIATASANSDASSMAGGLFGGVKGETASSLTTIDGDININVDVTAQTNGGALDIASPANKYSNSDGIFAGSIAGLSLDNNTTLNSHVNIANSVTIKTESEHAPVNEAIQASGGLYGAFVNSDLTYNPILFQLNNTGTVSNNNNTATGFQAGVFGLLDIAELNPTIAAGVTRGLLTNDGINDNANFDSGEGSFIYTSSNACGGPSGGLCNKSSATVFMELLEDLPDVVTGGHHSASSSHADEGESHSHAPHVPHNDHRSHHNEETEYAGKFNGEDYDGRLVHIGYPEYSFTIENNELFFMPFELQGFHGFSIFNKDKHGLYSKQDTGGHH